MNEQNLVPIADVIPADDPINFNPNPFPGGPSWPPGLPQPHFPFDPELPRLPYPFPPLKQLCFIDLKPGCYKIRYSPTGNNPFILPLTYYLGTLRVENVGNSKRISGDLYKFKNFLKLPFPINPPFLPVGDETNDASGIPIYGRTKYYSYLKGTGYSKSPIFSQACNVTVTMDEFVYNQPVAPSFNGTFNNAATRTIQIVVGQGASANLFDGSLYVGGVKKGSINLEWVSSSYRRAVVEIDTLQGAVAPMPLNAGTPTEENFATVFNTVGWEMTPIYNDTNVAVPAGIVATNCWGDADLHALMNVVRSAATNLDTEWRYHMMVVPGQLGCSRGKMFDQQGAHREGVVSYSNDGYNVSHSSNFGVAANGMQRDFPRAFLRSASHELGHCCNMVHQEGEGGADNSIMTTTPSVADVLGGPATGAPGVFPTAINLGFNDHCRQHLIHFPDVVVRPGGLNFAAGHSTFAPQASDYEVIDQAKVSFTIKTQKDHIKIGEPLLMAWEAVNKSGQEVKLPSDISHITEMVKVSVTDPDGKKTDIPSFVIECEHISIKPLADKAKLAAATDLFWGSKGFAFTKPGKHTVNIMVCWTESGMPTALSASKEIWVDYPVSAEDNEIAATMLNDEVGMYVALGGNAYHLKGACDRIARVMAIDPKHTVAKAMAKIYGTAAAAAYVPMTKKYVKKP
jgi:hypothetical protein